MNIIITVSHAKAKGYESITEPFTPHEMWMMGRVIADLKRNHIEFAVVSTDQGLEVWRKGVVCQLTGRAVAKRREVMSKPKH